MIVRLMKHRRLPGDHKGNPDHPLLLEGRRDRRRQVDLSGLSGEPVR